MRIKVLLVFIVLLAGFLRFWQLGTLAPSLTWDEVAWGYNAYSLGIDGKDEFGRFIPLNYLESFGDYKPPLYAYLDVIPVKIFGLTEFATRFPSAFLGTLSVLVTYFLVKRIFHQSERKKWYGICASLFLAISPWHIMLSRAAFEANVAMFLILSGAWLFFSWIQDKRPWMYYVSLLSFVLSVYTFNSARIVAPLLYIVLHVVFWKVILSHKKTVAIAIALGLIILIPFVQFSLSPQAKLRYNEVNIFSDVGLVKEANQEIANDKNAFWSKILHNRRIIYAAVYLQHYLDNLSPSFLFVKGDGNPKFATGDVGQLYLWDVPFLLIGFFFLFRKKIGYWWVIPIWILIAIIPAGVARETPHALRTEGMLPMWQIICAVGFVEACLFLNKYRKVYATVALGVLILFVGYFLHGYYAHYSREFSGEWQFGYKDALSFARSSTNKTIVITQALGRPYIYTLFYNHISPHEFRSTSTISRDVFGFVHVEKVGKYLFPNQIKPIPNALYIMIPGEVPATARVLQTFSLQNGQPSLVAYTL